MKNTNTIETISIPAVFPPAVRSRSLLPTAVSPFAMPTRVEGSWPTCTPSLIAPTANDLQDTSVHAGTSIVRFTDVVPATAGLGAYAGRKQGRPPRGTSS
ncbi:MAG TPA: hypothetical protein VGN18_18130 [Jatrophihabitans sp.]|nr:hypothetical protein [Jatrophihabitans sp.]